jgi:hypothetical protein
MEGAILALKSRRNSLAAISRLPPEILSKIFVCCAATSGLTMDWVKATHVSRHWRTVAMGCRVYLKRVIESMVKGVRYIVKDRLADKLSSSL